MNRITLSILLVLSLLLSLAACTQDTTEKTASPTVPALEITGNSDRGAELYKKSACVTCHSLDGSKLVGPTFQGLYGSEVEIEGEESVIVDDVYLRKSILDPSAQIVKGYSPMMPAIVTSEQDVADLLAFIAGIK